MAGSYNHMVNDENGKPISEGFGYPNLTIEPGGDVVETLEDCYGVIWVLASELSSAREEAGTRHDILLIIEDACERSAEGLARGLSGV